MKTLYLNNSMKKHYVFILIFISHFVLGQNPTGNSAEVGITEGQLSVSLSGGANYSIPIAVPPGINGVVPQVGLVYNSQGGNGMAGYGWNISGVSAITRIPRTKFHDGVVGGVNLDANDRFALDGQRLILKSGTIYGAAGTIYETENFSNVKITAIGVSPLGANYGPASFTVEYPDGSKAEYGLTTDSRSITTWGITYWENPQGVRISYIYNLNNNNLSIDSIGYGSVRAVEGINKIKFVYTARQRSEQSYVGGQSVLMNTILSEIKTIGNGVGFRNYVLKYFGQSSLGYQKLESIAEKSGDGTKSFNPTVFSYRDTNVRIDYNSTTTNFDITNISYMNYKPVSGDFNGDGKMDFILTSFTTSYSIYDNIINGATINGLKHDISFDQIFASNSISGDIISGYKLLPKQTWTVVKTFANGTSFKTFAKEPNNTIKLISEKIIPFPEALTNYCQLNDQTGNCELVEQTTAIPKKFLNGDFNGDGITDVIAIENSTVGHSTDCQGAYDEYANYMCSSANPVFIKYTSVFFINLDQRENNSSIWIGNLNSPGYSTYEVIDFNGDGKSDVMVIEDKKVSVYGMNDNFQFVLLYASPTDADIVITRPALTGDYNGDGKIDFIIPKGYGYNYTKYMSTGKAFIKQDVRYAIQYIQNDANNIYHIIPNDLNNDGKTDLILAQTNGTSSSGEIKVLFYCNKDSEFVFESLQTTGNQAGIKANPIPIFLSSCLPNKDLQICFISNNKIHSFQSDKNLGKELLSSIKTGNGVQEVITYSPLLNNLCTNNCIYMATEGVENYPNVDISNAPSFQVVSMLEKFSTSVYKKQFFSYNGAVSNVEGLGFLGFRASMRTNWFDDNNQIISSISKFDPNLRGANIENYTYLGLTYPETVINKPVANNPRNSKITINDTRTVNEIVVATNSIRFLPGANIKPTTGNTFIAQITPDYDANGFVQTNTTPPSNLISKSLSFYEASLSASKVYTLKNTQSNTYNILDNTSSETVMVYDAYNNPIESISKVRNAGIGEQTSISNIVYATPTTTPYVVGRPTSKSQSVSVTGDTTTSEELYAYTNSLLTQVKKKGNNTNYITEDNIYDAFGNITKKTITATGLPARETNYEYNPVFPYNGRFLTKSIDVETLATTFIYNPNNGLLDSETNPFGLTTSYLYDAWFKKTKTTDYLGKSNTYAYSRSNNVNTLVTTTGDDGSYSEEVFDDLGRKITSGAKDITGATSKVSYEYDIYDRNIKASEPYIGTGASQWNETQYDEYGRTIQNISFTGKTVSVTYSGLTTTVNDGSKTKTSVKNALGNVVSMTDSPGGTINYTYFANGNLKTTNFDGTVTTIEQDGWGRKTKLTDPSAGTYTYAYNDFGETTSETTPNGTTTYTLNAVGKLTAKTISGTNTNSSTVYNYNSTTKLLDSSTFTDIANANAITTNTYTYDGYKRLVSTTEATPYATFTKTINLFDAFGRVETETTSGTANGKTSAKKIKNTYKNGYAYQILDDANQQVLWETNTVNARGRLLTAKMGNGIDITNDYDTYGFAAKFQHDKTGTSPANIMTLITTFDEKKGNLKTRTNSMFGWSEDFTNSYDNLDRLTSYKNAQGVVVTQTYNEDGRIDVNTLGKYNYTNTAKKYQNTSITLTLDARTYYQNRGIAAIPSPTAARALNITYNTFKSPVEIKEDGVDNLSFVYNDNNDRSTMFYGSTNPDKNLRPNRKYYAADGSMEIKQNISTGVTEFITYIGGDGYSAPIVLKSDGTTQNYLYLHRDYQGSILAITDANAVVLEKRLFDAWGAILKVQNGAGVDLNVLTILDRGYTGHEHLQSVGLINMNARLYDPKLHRFLQPDNYVEDPSNTQSYNRYGYCWNNPLKSTDITGNWGGWDDLAAMLIGGLINWGAHGFQMNMQGLKAFAIGAVAGELALYTGGAAFAAAGGAAAGGGGFVAGAYGAMVGYATSQPFLNSANHVAFGDPLMTMGEYATGIALSGFTGGTINGVSAKLNGNTFWKGTPPRIKVQPITIYIKQVGEGGNAAIKTGDYKITGPPTEPDFVSNTKLPSTTQTSTAPTTQNNTATVINKETGFVDVSKNPDFGIKNTPEYPASYLDKPSGTGTPNSFHKYTTIEGKPLQNTFYNNDGKAVLQLDFKPHGTGNINGVPHGHIIKVPGIISTGHQGEHIPFMLIKFGK